MAIGFGLLIKEFLMFIGATIALVLYNGFLAYLDAIIPDRSFNLNRVIPLGIVITGIGVLIGSLFQ